MRIDIKGLASKLRNRIQRFYGDPLSTTEHRVIQDLFRESKGMVVTLILCFGIGIYTVWGHVPNTYVYTFLALFVVEALVKVTISNKFSNASQAHQRAPVWRQIIVYGSVWSGVVYGIVGLALFLPVTNDERLVLIGVFFGLLQISAMSGAFFQIIAAWMLVPAVLPTTIALLVIASKTTLLLAAMLLVVTASAILLARLSARRFRNITELNDENQRLLTIISREQENADNERKKAEQAVVKNSRFMAAASHDLRQPLHAIGLFQHALRLKTQNDESAYLFDSIDRSMEVLNAMFDSLMDISQLDAKSIAPEWLEIDSTRFFAPLVEETRFAAMEKGLEFKTELEPTKIKTDPLLLSRIVRNLLGNAVKFTDRGSIKLSTFKKENKLAVEVTDTGRGIPESEKQNIFEEFYQITAETGRQHGVGLGLSIVSRLCHLLDVTLKVKNNTPAGTTFLLEIPTFTNSHSYHSQVAPPLPNSCISNLKILFIDDEQEIRDAMQQTLEIWKCDYIGFVKPDDAYSSLRQNDFIPDLLICDYQLHANKNGLEVIQALREKIGFTVPSILLSGEKSTDLEALCRRDGVVPLTKPVQPAALKSAIVQLSPFTVKTDGSAQTRGSVEAQLVSVES